MVPVIPGGKFNLGTEFGKIGGWGVCYLQKCLRLQIIGEFELLEGKDVTDIE